MLEIILLVMAIVGIFEGVRLSKSVLLFVDPVGPGWYLFFISCLLFICALSLLVRAFMRRKLGQNEAILSLHGGVVGRVLLLLFLYAVAVTYMGYLTASTIFFVWAQRLFGERSWGRCVLIGVIITACFYLVFIHFANLPVPQGRFL